MSFYTVSLKHALFHKCSDFSPFTDEAGSDAVEFDVNMTAEELSELFRQKGVDEVDCALFRSMPVRCIFGKGSSVLTRSFSSPANKVNGRVFSKMKLTHIDQMGVSFGSRILIEKLLEDIVSLCMPQ